MLAVFILCFYIALFAMTPVSGISIARRRRRRARALEKYVEETMSTNVLHLFAKELQNPKSVMNNTAFCKMLKKTVFPRSTLISSVNISDDLLSYFAEQYMELVYTPTNFPYTYRVRNATNPLTMNFKAKDIRRYYRKRCPYFDFSGADVRLLDDWAYYLFLCASGAIMLFYVAQ
jgi:hypothetical protein